MLVCDYGLFSIFSFLVCAVVILMAATLLLTVKKVTYYIYHGEQFGLVEICAVTFSCFYTPHLVV